MIRVPAVAVQHRLEPLLHPRPIVVHDRIPRRIPPRPVLMQHVLAMDPLEHRADPLDRKSTRLNSSHATTSYAVFCLKKKILSTSRALFAARNISYRATEPVVHAC